MPLIDGNGQSTAFEYDGADRLPPMFRSKLCR
jgi:YD repeat-containing protein